MSFWSTDRRWRMWLGTIALLLACYRTFEHAPWWPIGVWICLSFLHFKDCFVPQVRVYPTHIVVYPFAFPRRILTSDILSVGPPKTFSWNPQHSVEIRLSSGKPVLLNLEKPADFVSYLTTDRSEIDVLPTVPPPHFYQFQQRKLTLRSCLSLVYDHKTHTIHAPDEDPQQTS